MFFLSLKIICKYFFICNSLLAPPRCFSNYAQFDFSDTAGYQNCQIGQINVYILIQAYLCLINSFNIDKHNKYIDTNWFFEIDNIKTTIVKDFIIKSINQFEISDDTIGWSLWAHQALT